MKIAPHSPIRPGKRSRMRSRAFTLLELLVVVAIIAILAAIAIPNFLEAQTRAKISRAKADLRTVSMALEAYAIDYNGNYPHLNTYVPSGRYLTAGHYDRGSILSCTNLSTPVAYLSSVNFNDPFTKGTNFNEFGLIDDKSSVYNESSKTIIYMNAKLFYSYKKQKMTPPNRPPYYLVSLGPDFVKGPNPLTGGSWALSSYLSVKDPDGSCRYNAWNYDPSNGTTSGGDILRAP
jgi:prepilin-type N-terminal cleavage/methylation domain-containing protein